MDLFVPTVLTNLSLSLSLHTIDGNNISVSVSDSSTSSRGPYLAPSHFVPHSSSIHSQHERTNQEARISFEVLAPLCSPYPPVPRYPPAGSPCRPAAAWSQTLRRPRVAVEMDAEGGEGGEEGCGQRNIREIARGNRGLACGPATQVGA